MKLIHHQYVLLSRKKFHLIKLSRSKLSTSTIDEIEKKFLKTTTIHTCRNVYDKLRLESPGLYKKSPSNGLDLTIDYIDTKCSLQNSNSNDSIKTIVALHGSADTYRTFLPIVDYFKNRNDVRVVVPNFPDFSHTRQTGFKFWHSSDENNEFLSDLFKKLNINQIDCIIGHSRGNQLITTLIENNEKLKIKSIIMLAPQFLFDKAIEQSYTYAYYLLQLSKSSIITNLLNLSRIYRLKMFLFKFTHIDQLFFLCTVIVDKQSIIKAPERIRLIKSLKIPTYIIYSSDERIITSYSQNKLFNLLQIDNGSIFIDHNDPQKIDQKLLIQSNNDNDDFIKKIIIKDGRHFPHQKSPNIINYLIEKFVDHF